VRGCLGHVVGFVGSVAVMSLLPPLAYAFSIVGSVATSGDTGAPWNVVLVPAASVVVAVFCALLFAGATAGLQRLRRRRAFSPWLPAVLIAPLAFLVMLGVSVAFYGRPGLRLGILWGTVAGLGFLAYWLPASRIGGAQQSAVAVGRQRG